MATGTARRKQLVGTLILAGVGIAAAIAVLTGGLSGNRGEEPALAAFCGRDLGSADSPVRITAFLPVNNGCQDALGLYLADVTERFPDVFRLRILAMKSEEGQVWRKEKGIRCACVMINDRTAFDLGGEAGKVLLEGPMDPLDVYRVLRQEAAAVNAEAAAAIPPPPEGIDIPDAMGGEAVE